MSEENPFRAVMAGILAKHVDAERLNEATDDVLDAVAAWLAQPLSPEEKVEAGKYASEALRRLRDSSLLGGFISHVERSN